REWRMAQETMDRRVRRTRDLLHRALLDLIAEKGYPHITVQDILDRADVGRSTFYTHYRDKEDLLRSGIADFNAAAEGRSPAYCSRCWWCSGTLRVTGR